MNNNELDELLSDEFLSSLDQHVPSEVSDELLPDWVPMNENDTFHKSYKAILQLRSDKERDIKNYKQIANNQTPKGLYTIHKTDVGRAVDRSQQNIFSNKKNSLCAHITDFLQDVNKELFSLFEKEQALLNTKQKPTGVRVMHKEDLVKEYQQLREKYEALKCWNIQAVADEVISRLPLDLQQIFKTRKS